MNAGAVRIHPGLFLAVETLCFWPVWKWYVERIQDGSDEPWGIVALLTALAFAGLRRKHRAAPLNPWATIPLALYVIFYPSLPCLVRAALAILSLGLTVSPLLFGTTLHLGFTALLLLSLPIIASLQFYLGFPLRVVNGEIVAFLLRLGGEFVSAHGTTLLWRGDSIAIDAPCSGIKMLWGGLYCCFTLACFAGLSNRRTWVAYSFAALSIFAANIVRTYVLFFSETRIIEMPSWFHPAVGLLCFAVNLCAVFLFIRYIQSYEEHHSLA